MEEEASADQGGGGGGGPLCPWLDASVVKVVSMSEDHKPDLPDEHEHIESASLIVQTHVVQPSSDGRDPRGDSGGRSAADMAAVIYRIRKSDSNLLGVSCAFGNFDCKSNAGLPPSRQAVVCTPNVTVRE